MSDSHNPLYSATCNGQAAAAALIERLVPLHEEHVAALSDIERAIEGGRLSAASGLFRSAVGQQAFLRMPQAFSCAVQVLADHADMMANSAWLLEDDAAGELSPGVARKVRPKKKPSARRRRDAEKGGVAAANSTEATATPQLDDDTIVSLIEEGLDGSDWASASPGKLRGLLFKASPAASASEKRIKKIKAAVLEKQQLLARIDAGEVAGCTICLSAVADHVLQHGDTAHQCICSTCAESGKLTIGPGGSGCTICRLEIDAILALPAVKKYVKVFVA
jgi:hypothetical protein